MTPALIEAIVLPVIITTIEAVVVVQMCNLYLLSIGSVSVVLSVVYYTVA